MTTVLRHTLVRPSRVVPRTERYLSSALHRLCAVVLLTGSIRPSPFASAIRRSSLDLPLDTSGSTVLDAWTHGAEELASVARLPRLTVRVLLCGDSPIAGASQPRASGLSVSVQRDAKAYRGTGGVIHDVAADYDDDDRLLIAAGAQVLTRPLARLAHRLSATHADVAVLASTSGSPITLAVVRCGAVRSLPAVGYVDFKEQALPTLAASHHVAVVRDEQPSLLPIRNDRDYLHAIRHRLPSPGFVIREPRTQVHPTARLHDAVVLRGARIGPRAVVVRSIVCEDAVVEPSSVWIDAVIGRSPLNGRDLGRAARGRISMPDMQLAGTACSVGTATQGGAG